MSYSMAPVGRIAITRGLWNYAVGPPTDHCVISDQCEGGGHSNMHHSQGCVRDQKRSTVKIWVSVKLAKIVGQDLNFGRGPDYGLDIRLWCILE